MKKAFIPTGGLLISVAIIFIRFLPEYTNSMFQGFLYGLGIALIIYGIYTRKPIS